MLVDAVVCHGRARKPAKSRWLARPAVVISRIFIMLGDERDADL